MTRIQEIKYTIFRYEDTVFIYGESKVMGGSTLRTPLKFTLSQKISDFQKSHVQDVSMWSLVFAVRIFWVTLSLRFLVFWLSV